MKSLTPMQAASWVGRQSPQALGGVAAHLYAEFDGAISDIPRFLQAVKAVYCTHPMLRLQVTSEGRQRVVSDFPPSSIDDFRHHHPAGIPQLLAAKRRRMENQQLLLDKGHPCEISLTLLPEGASRLHIDLDMIAADAESFRIVTEDLARCYETAPARHVPEMEVSWFNYLDLCTCDPLLLGARERDRAWWRQRLADIPPAPHIPYSNRQCQTRRMATRLGREASHALQRCARHHHLTLSALFLSLFSLTMTEGFRQPSMRINVPTFFRAPVIAGHDEIVGDFSDLLLFHAQLHPNESLLRHCQRTMAQLHEIVGHSGYSGVSVMRDLSRLRGHLQYSPIVFTAGFGIRGGKLFSERVERQLGTLEWVISQGPQVALDAQVAWLADEILINWDVREDAFPPGQLQQLFSRFHSLARRLAQTPQSIHDSVSRWLEPSAIRMLLKVLAERMAPGLRLSSMTREHQETLLAFINRYFPGVSLGQQELAALDDWGDIASLIERRAGKRAMTMASQLLAILDKHQ